MTSSLGDTFDSMNSMMSKSETISTLSMSSLEVSEGVRNDIYSSLNTASDELHNVHDTKVCCRSLCLTLTEAEIPLRRTGF